MRWLLGLVCREVVDEVVAGTLLVLLDEQDVAVEDGDFRFPVIAEGVAGHGETGAAHAAALAEEPRLMARKAGVEGVAVEDGLTIPQGRAALGPDFARAGTELGLVRGNQVLLPHDAHVAREDVAAAFLVKAGRIGADGWLHLAGKFIQQAHCAVAAENLSCQWRRGIGFIGGGSRLSQRQGLGLQRRKADVGDWWYGRAADEAEGQQGSG